MGCRKGPEGRLILLQPWRARVRVGARAQGEWIVDRPAARGPRQLLFNMMDSIVDYQGKDSKGGVALKVDGFTPSQCVLDGTTLVSSDGSFELGFFSPGSSKNRYLGIWFKNVPVRTVVWVANRCNPINDTSGVLMINSTGNLVLLSQNSSVVWSTSLVKQAQNATVELLDSGNLVLRDAKDGNSGTYLWQSFDYPSDTLLPGMKLGWDLRTGLKRHLSACTKFFRTSAWNELTICGSPEHPSPRYSFNFVYNNDEVFVTYKPKIESILSRVVLNQTTSTCARFQWKVGYQAWQDFSSRPTESCDYYGFCGANGNCTSEDPVCKCIQGFSPKSQEKWNLADWSLGCVRNKPLSCHEGDKDEFLKFDGFKLPDTTNSWVDKSMNLKECRDKCLKNCSCTAYTSSDIGGGSGGCTIWFGDLIDIKQVPVAGKEIYIRTSAAEIVNNEGENSRKVKIAIIVVGIAIVFSGVLLVGYVIRRRKRKNEANRNPVTEIRERNEDNEGAPRGDMELPLFDLMTVARATDNFSSNKKLGEGGFGPVYKGTLADGQEIAVKRLSRSSSQGLNEFMNEVILIAKLQHRNLVRLLGCCVQGEEKLLLYEYMPNGSLDSSIFGLIYLHQDSRLRIIHRDLKASNVLLDNEMNPKISDFGLLWRLWNEGKPLELIDACLGSSGTISEVLRCINIGLLCAQHHPDDRPSMADVVIMLGSQTALARPKQPGFFIERGTPEAGSNSGGWAKLVARNGGFGLSRDSTKERRALFWSFGNRKEIEEEEEEREERATVAGNAETAVMAVVVATDLKNAKAEDRTKAEK
ncbi:unnamed protein product [Malus baccata var. baccata]